MRKKVRGLVYVCTAAAFALTLSGCGETKENTKETVNSGKGDENRKGETQEISFWNIGTGDADSKIYEKAEEIFNTNTDSDYRIVNTAVEPDSYKEKIVVAMSSGECPDIYTNWSGGPMNEYIEAGFGQPVDELFQNSIIKDEILDAAVKQGQYQDKLYSIGIMNNSIAGVFYNKEIFEKYDLEVPKTVEELEKVCDTLVENQITPFALANMEKWTGSMFFMSLATRYGGIEPFQKAVSGEGTFEEDCFLYAGEKIQEWEEKGYFPEGVNSLSEASGQGRELIYKEQAAMMLNGSWYASTFLGDSPEFYEKIGWFPFPAIEGKEQYQSIVIGTIGDHFVTFNCTGEKQKAAFEFIETFFQEDMKKFMVEQGKIPPMKGIGEMIEDPVNKQILEAVNQAENTQLWYDQYLPPAVSQVHLDTCQELFGLSITPEDAASAFEQTMEEYNQKKEEK